MINLYIYIYMCVCMCVYIYIYTHTLLYNYTSYKVAQTVKNLLAMQETWVQSPDWEDPLEEGMATHQYSNLENCHGQKSLAGYSPWGHRVGHNWSTKHIPYISIYMCVCVFVCVLLSIHCSNIQYLSNYKIAVWSI